MMKKPRELIEFLFGDSQQASEREMLTRDFAHIFEEMERQEELEPKKTPLKSALSKLGVKAELNDDFTISVEEPAEYRKIKAKLSDPDTMEELAELGWVVADCGDVAMTGEEADFRFRFTEITQDEPDNSEKRPGRKDLEAIVKAAKEFSYSPKEEQPDPKKGSKAAGVGKPKPGGNAEHAIKDSVGGRWVLKCGGKYYVADDEPLTSNVNKALTYGSRKAAEADARINTEQWGKAFTVASKPTVKDSVDSMVNKLLED
jgi:hypothetical protein